MTLSTYNIDYLCALNLTCDTEFNKRTHVDGIGTLFDVWLLGLEQGLCQIVYSNAICHL